MKNSILVLGADVEVQCGLGIMMGPFRARSR